MSTGRALTTLAVVVLVIGTYLALTALLGVREYWPGFLFLLQWSMMEEMKPERLPRSIIGAADGLAIASLPAWLAPSIGTIPALVVLTVTALVATFALIRGIAPILVNPATMVFLTVATIPHVARGAAVLDLFVGLAAGVTFFGGLASIAAALTKPKTAPAAPERNSTR